MGTLRTVREALDWGTTFLRKQDVESPRLTCELLLADCLNTARMDLLTRKHRELTGETAIQFREWIERRIDRVPVQYITGHVEFFSRPFDVDPRAMIPRPETEVLVEKTLNRLPRRASRDTGRTVCDLGTGSGVILITLLLERPDLSGVGIDVSPDALELARENAARHNVLDRLELMEADFLTADDRRRLAERGPFDAVVTNPPYITSEERDQLAPEVAEHEPDRALFVPCDRDELYQRLCDLAETLTGEEGRLFMELSEFDQPAPDELRRETRLASATLERDHRGVERILIARTS